MKNKSIVTEGREIALAVQMIELGARMQMLEAETHLSRERLLKLYKEVKGVSPPKGMLPFSTDWFMTWQPNIHSSLFMSFLKFLEQHTELRNMDAILKAFQMYRDHLRLHGMDEVLSLTRAWTLVRFFEARMLHTVSCTKCAGHFVAHAHDPVKGYVCGLCNMPARAGKTRRVHEGAGMVPA